MPRMQPAMAMVLAQDGGAPVHGIAKELDPEHRADDGGDLVIPPGESLSNEAWNRVVDGILGSCSTSTAPTTSNTTTSTGPSAPSGPAA